MGIPIWASALSATMIIQIASSVAAATLPMLAPVLTTRWEIAPENVGYVTAATSVGICWCLACGNPMLRYNGPVRTLQIGLSFIAVGVVCLIMPHPASAFLGALFLGLGIAPNNPAGSAILAKASPTRHRNLIFSIRQAGVPAGGVIAGAISAPTLASLGFYWAAAALIAILALSILGVQPWRSRLDMERDASSQKWLRAFLDPTAIFRSATILHRQPALQILTAIGISFSIVQNCVLAFTTTYLVVHCGRDLIDAGNLLAVLLLSSAIGRIGLGWVADRLGQGLLLLCFLLLAASLALLSFILAAKGPPLILIASVALIGATALGWTGVYMAELARAAPPQLVGEVTSAANLYGFVGAVGGPIAFSLAANITGSFNLSFMLIALQAAALGPVAIWRYYRQSELTPAAAQRAT